MNAGTAGSLQSLGMVNVRILYSLFIAEVISEKYVFRQRVL